MSKCISQRNITIYYISQFLYALVFTIPIWIVYYQGRITTSQMGFLVAFQYAAQLLLELPTGAFADLFGRKISVALGYLLWGIFYLLVVGTTGFAALFIATFLSGFAESLISGSLEALMYDSLKQDGMEEKYVSVTLKNGLYFQIALAIATCSGGFLYQFGWAIPYIGCAIANILAFIASLLFIEPNLDTQKFSLPSYIAQIRDGSLHAFANKKTALMSTFYILVSSITWTNNLYFFDFILVDLHFSDIQRSVIGAAIRIINVIVLNLLVRNERIFTRKRSIFFFPIVMTICFLPGITFRGYIALPLIAGAVMAGTARWIILTKYTNELFESKYRATAISSLSMIVGILFVGITAISGPIIQLYGVKMMYSVLGLMTLVSVLPLSFFVERSQQKML